MTYNLDVESIQVSNTEVNQFAEELSQILKSKITAEELEPKLKILKAAANNFLVQYQQIAQALDELTKNYEHIEQIQNGICSTDKSDEEDKTNEIINYDEKLKEVRGIVVNNNLGEQMYSSVLVFQAALNDFFNQKMLLTIVYRDKIYYTTEMEDYSHYLTYDLHDNKVSARFNNLQNLIDHLQTAVEWKPSEEYNIEAVKNVLYGKKSALWRYNRSRSVIKNYNANQGNEEGKNFRGGLVLWNRPHWQGAWVWNKGDINEAYATIILNRQATNEYQSNDINSILNRFMQIVLNVDSISGVLTGDYSGSGQLEYAIKSSRASALGYAQFKELADIVNSESFSPNLLNEWWQKQKNQGQTRNILIENIKEIGEEELVDILKKAAAAK